MEEEKRAMKHIYTLRHGATVFYVGRTNDPERREREHRSAWRRGVEDKYVYIRENLVLKGINWYLEVEKSSEVEEYNSDWERWYVIHYLREGHPIQNMRHGDLDTLNILNEQVMNKNIQGPDDVRNDRIERERRKRERVNTLHDDGPLSLSSQVAIEEATISTKLADTIIKALNGHKWTPGKNYIVDMVWTRESGPKGHAHRTHTVCCETLNYEAKGWRTYGKAYEVLGRQVARTMARRIVEQSMEVENV